MWAYRLVADRFERELACDHSLRSRDSLVEITHWSLCGSDARGIKRGSVNAFVGHECAGVLVGAKGQRTNQVVSIFPIVPCFCCARCSVQDYRNCVARRTIGFELPGATARFLAVDSRLIFHHAAGTSAADAALSEHLACCIHLLKSAIGAGLKPGSRVFIVGDGAMAFGAATVFKKLLQCSVFVSAKHPVRSRLAERIGFESPKFKHREVAFAASECDLLVLACRLEDDAFEAAESRSLPLVAMVARQSERIEQVLARNGAQFIDSYAYSVGDFADAVRCIDDSAQFIDYGPTILNMSTLKAASDLLCLSKLSVKYVFRMV